MMFLAQSHTDTMEGLLELNSAPPLFSFHSLWALGAAVVHISALSGLCGGWVLLLPWLPSVFPLPWGMVPEMPLSFKDTAPPASRGLWLASPNHLPPSPDFFLFFLKIFTYLFIFGCVGSSLLLRGRYPVVASRDYFSCGAWASHCGSFSCC